jgi:hypothetical protein
MQSYKAAYNVRVRLDLEDPRAGQAPALPIGRRSPRAPGSGSSTGPADAVTASMKPGDRLQRSASMRSVCSTACPWGDATPS